MNIEQKKFGLYLTVLRFLPFKITNNLKRIYLDFDMNANRMMLTAYYEYEPSELELELLDDIVTNSNAPIPDFFIEGQYKLAKNFDKNEKHDFVVFSVYDYELFQN
jgi:hypothetical protein